jgi:hypothetical protein
VQPSSGICIVPRLAPLFSLITAGQLSGPPAWKSVPRQVPANLGGTVRAGTGAATAEVLVWDVLALGFGLGLADVTVEGEVV